MWKNIGYDTPQHGVDAFRVTEGLLKREPLIGAKNTADVFATCAVDVDRRFKRGKIRRGIKHGRIPCYEGGGARSKWVRSYPL